MAVAISKRKLFLSYPKKAVLADSMIAIAVLGWAISFPIAKLALTDWQDFKFFFLAGRFWLAFLIFLPFALSTHGVRGVLSHLKPGFLVGATLIFTYAFQFDALSRPATSSGEVAFITSLSSALVPLFMWVIFRARMHPATLAGLMIAIVGVAVMRITDVLSLSLNPGSSLAFVGAIGVALDTILIDYFRKMETPDGAQRYHTVPFLVTQFITVALGTSIVSLVWEYPSHGAPTLSYNALFAMIFMAVVATGVAFYLQARFQSDTTPDRVALIFTIEPPAAALFSYFILAEVFTISMLLGAALILVGVGGSEFLAARRALRDTKVQ